MQKIGLEPGYAKSLILINVQKVASGPAKTTYAKNVTRSAWQNSICRIDNCTGILCICNTREAPVRTAHATCAKRLKVLHMQKARSAWKFYICKIDKSNYCLYICNLREAPEWIAYAIPLLLLHIQLLYSNSICNTHRGYTHAITPMYPLCNTRNATAHAIAVNEWAMQHL